MNAAKENSTSSSSTVNTVSQSPALPIRVIKIGIAKSYSGNDITYHVGCSPDLAVYVRLFHSSGKGIFSQAWISLAEIKQKLESHPSDQPLTSYALHTLYQGSVNSRSYLVAVLLNENLLCPSTTKLRSYDCADGIDFFEEIKALISAGTDIKILEKPKLIGPVKKYIENAAPVKPSKNKSGKGKADASQHGSGEA